MNEQLALAPVVELLSVRDVATLLKLQPRAVQLRMAKIAPAMRDGIRVWALDQFPADYQEQLRFVKKRSGLWTLAEVLHQVFQAKTHWKPDFVFAKLPAFSQAKAYKVKAVMQVYFAALDEECTKHQAECAARTKWLEEFSTACNAKTIQRWAAKIDERGTIEHAEIAAYADRKSCPHENARLECRTKKPRIPGELIHAFKALCVQPSMNMAAAWRKLEMDWQCGRSVPGIGSMTEARQPFPFKITQLRKFAPSTAERKLGNEGKAAALRDALPHMTRTYETLRPCELYILDDTRSDVTAIDDDSGKPMDITLYICLEAASRRIVGYALREGSMHASDVDRLMARVLRSSGLAHPNAGYKTTFQFERGTVACSSQRQLFLESMFPSRLRIKRTSMNGGQNFPGDYVQENSGHWMGKGAIESFNKTLNNRCRHIAGQRGSIYQKAPKMVGDPNSPHAGGMVDEAVQTGEVARIGAFLKSKGTDTNPHARDALEAAGLKIPMLHLSVFRQALSQAIEHYNAEQGHRREGFRLLPVEKKNGGLEYISESSNERWTYLNWREEQRGTAPQRIAPAEAAMLLYKARAVTITQQGAWIEVDKRRYRYWHEDSIACEEAGLLTGVKKQYIALCDPEDLSEIFILRNAVAGYREGDTAQFVESLPLYEKPPVNDDAALAQQSQAQWRVRNRKVAALTKIYGPMLAQRTEERRAVSKFIDVVTTSNGANRETADLSYMTKGIRLEKSKHPNRDDEAASEPTRADQMKSSQAALARSLAGAVNQEEAQP
jgi:hypothetical protein